MTPKNIALLVGAGVLLSGMVWDQMRRSPAVQVPLTFERLATAFNEHDASGIMACVDRSYDFTGKWPNIFSDEKKARGLAQQGLAMAFLRAGQDPVTMAWTLEKMTVNSDGTVQATVSMKLSGGLFTNAIPELTHHQFSLVQAGWISGRYRIDNHAPFVLHAPEL